jgi:hypothetical protein
MNGKKERDLFAAGLKQLLRRENEIAEEYHALAELVEGLPAGLLLDWVVTEQEAHYTLLFSVIKSLKQISKRESGNGADRTEMERDNVLRWIERLRLKEKAVAADCRSLKSQAYWEEGDLMNALLDALVMDSEKHQRFLLTMEKTVKT